MSSLKILCRYQYDPLDRLTGIKPLEHLGTQRFYQENDLANEIEGQIQLTILRHEAQPLAQRLRIANVAETTLLATDQQHSVLQTRTATDTQHLAYTAYGHHPVESGLSSLLGFNGERPDPITGHYLLGQGNRAFNPVLMRFNSPDELSPFGDGGINPYSYCGGDPVNRYDPSGNSPVSWIIKPWLYLPTTNYQPLMDAYKNRINTLATQSVTISRPTTSRPNQTGMFTPRKIDPQRYEAITPPDSALPAEPSLTLFTQINSPHTTIATRNELNSLISNALVYDKAVERYPFMRTWTATPGRIKYNAAKARYEQSLLNATSSRKVEEASAELTLARWRAKKYDILQLVETRRSEVRRQ